MNDELESPEKRANRPARREEVAREAGVSVAAVSLALRGRPGVSEKTRAQIVEVAARMGYQIDSAAALLARKRHREVREEDRLLVAFFGPKQMEQAFAETCRAAGLLGRCIDPASVPSPSAMLRELWHQGVSGLIFSPGNLDWRGADPRLLAWGHFSVVKMSRANSELPFQLARHSAFDYMMTTLLGVVARGYRRLAVLMLASDSERDDDARLGALHSFQSRRLPRDASCVWREVSYSEKLHLSPATLAWVKEHNPDVIVLPHWVWYYGFRNAGYGDPRRMGMAAVMGDSGQTTVNVPLVSGCDLNNGEHLSCCVETLRELMLHGQRGFPAHHTEHVIEPVWIEGDTLPTKAAGLPVHGEVQALG